MPTKTYHDDDDDGDAALKPKLELVRPLRAPALIRKMILRDPDITLALIRATLDAASVNASPGLVSCTADDTKAMLKLLAQHDLLADDFEERRRRLPVDFHEESKAARKRRLDKARTA